MAQQTIIDLTGNAIIDLTKDNWNDAVDYYYVNAFGKKSLLQRRTCRFQTCLRKCQLEMCSEHLCDVLGVEVKESNIPGAGFGLFATREFKKNQTIIFFTGSAITRLGIIKKEYTLWRGKSMYYDCSVKRCAAACANTLRVNNCKTVAFRLKCSLKTTKKIRAGDELTTPYGRSYTLNA